jgi:hypothetical protein
MLSYAKSNRSFLFHVYSFFIDGKVKHAVYFLGCICLFAASGLNAQNRKISFSFTLSKASNTSAGVFRKDSTLVRTLWNNVRHEAGTHTSFWDRKDDEGHFMTDSHYVIRILSGNLTYKWEGGIIGNTSDSMTGSSKHRYFEKPNSMAIHGNTAYFSAGYSEGITSAYKLDLNTPQNRSGVLSRVGDIDQHSEHTATDGKYVYWAGFDPFRVKTSFVYAVNSGKDDEAKFDSGISVAMTYGRTYSWAIDPENDDPLAHPSGLAVQKNGNFLFVSHAGINELHVLDKTSGALVRSISMNSPRELCVDMNDMLWVISGSNSVQKFMVNSNGTLSSPILSIPGLLEPVSIAVSPNNHIVAIADAGSSQQVKAFKNANGDPAWILGQAGGYAADAEVRNDKFYFRDAATRITGGVLLAFQQDSSFWIGDPGNDRLQHFSSSRSYIDNIMSLPCTYSVKADPNDPSRVFANFLEFRIDYSKPLAPGNGSWVLVKNWRRGVPSNYFGAFSILRNVITLSNGRTYATLEDPAGQVHELVELPASGNLRFTGIRISTSEDFLIDRDGSLRTIHTGNVNDTIQWTHRALTGFSGDNPVWAAANTIASSPPTTINDPKPNGQTFPVKTDSDNLIVFCHRKRDGFGLRTGYHLGAIKKGTSKWLWKTSMATPESYSGQMPPDGTFDIGNGVEYPAGAAYTIDNSIFWNYNGEFWRNSQTNIWNHYADNGLMLGQFGITTPEGQRLYGPEAFPMGAGNAFSAAFVKIDSIYYLYHNDESVHGAIHRWKISGMGSIREQRINVPVQTINGGITAMYYNGKDLNNLNTALSEISPLIKIDQDPVQVSNKQDFSVRWQGYVHSLYNQVYSFHTLAGKGVRLWVDDRLVIDQWKNKSEKEFTSLPVILDTAVRYTIRMEVSGGPARLYWSSASQVKALVAKHCLYPAGIDEEETGTDLQDGLGFSTMLEDGLYGWKRDPAVNDSTGALRYWIVNTNIKSYGKQHPDLYMTFKGESGKSTVTRDLGKVSPCIAGWKLSGTLNYEDNYATWDQHGGSHMQVVDDQGRVIARITHELIFDNDMLFPTQVKCNGEAIVNQNQNKLAGVTTRDQPFELTVSKDGVIFAYAGYVALSVPLMDPACNWNRPVSLQFVFEGGSNNHQRSADVTRLRFEAFSAPAIHIEGTGSVCEGVDIRLSAGKSAHYLWSTGAVSQGITVSASGTYYVKTSDQNGCSETSASLEVTVHPLPVPEIKAVGNILNSGVDSGNQWYFEENPIKGADTRSYLATQSGTYKVIVTDDRGCRGQAVYTHQLGMKSNSSQGTVLVSPNPGNGIFRIFHKNGPGGRISVHKMTGELILETENNGQEINISFYGSGIYLLTLTNEAFTSHHKLIINH